MVPFVMLLKTKHGLLGIFPTSLVDRMNQKSLVSSYSVQVVFSGVLGDLLIYYHLHEDSCTAWWGSLCWTFVLSSRMLLLEN